MDSDRPDAPSPSVDDFVKRTARVRAMLARWEEEPVTDEPDWSIEDIEPMLLAGDKSSKR